MHADRASGLSGCLLLYLMSGCAGSAETPRSDSLDNVAAHGGETSEAQAGLVEVAIGSISLNQRNEVTCSFTQDEHDEVQLSIALTPKCATVGSVTIEVSLGDVTLKTSVALAMNAGHKVQLDSPPFQLPKEGEMIRVQVQAKCSGTNNERAVGSAHCVVPK